MTRPIESALECIDPAVGERVLELLDGTPTGRERDVLEAHRDACTHCRLLLDLERGLDEGLGDESPDADGPRVVGTIQRRAWTGWAAAAAIAAGFVLMLGLPPRPVGPDLSVRGKDLPAFKTPVEGEVVAAGDLELRWDPVPGSASYRLRVSGTEQGTIWTGTSREPRLEVPAGSGLEPGGEYRALLSTVPGDLLPPGGTSVSFRTGTRTQILLHRTRHAQPASYGLALAGLLLGVVFLFGRRP